MTKIYGVSSPRPNILIELVHALNYVISIRHHGMEGQDLRFADLLHRYPLDPRDDMRDLGNSHGLVSAFHHTAFLPFLFLNCFR